MDVSDIFNFFSAWGRGRGRARFLIENPGRGGWFFQEKGGGERGAERVFAVNFFFFWGGGLNIFLAEASFSAYVFGFLKGKNSMF